MGLHKLSLQDAMVAIVETLEEKEEEHRVEDETVGMDMEALANEN